jgi:hypothetical protein
MLSKMSEQTFTQPKNGGSVQTRQHTCEEM